MESLPRAAPPARWRPKPVWTGYPAFVLGGGPSLRGFDFDQLRGRCVIALNAAGYDAPWADVLLFGDTSFFVEHRPLIEDFRGVVATLSVAAATALPAVRLLDACRQFAFIPGAAVNIGRSIGHTGVGLAAALGASPIVLLGFDGEPRGGAWHYHDRYAPSDRGSWAAELQRAWVGYGDMARKAGIEIWNASPGSAINEFPHADLTTFLGQVGT